MYKGKWSEVSKSRGQIPRGGSCFPGRLIFGHDEHDQDEEGSRELRVGEHLVLDAGGEALELAAMAMGNYPDAK